MTAKHTRCLALGICQGLGPDQCPDCDGWECEVACSPEPPRPTYPFAPGVIQGPADPLGLGMDDGQPLSAREHAIAFVMIFGAIGAVAFLVGYLVERFA